MDNFRAIGQILMEILHINEIGNTESVVANEVWVFIYSLAPFYVLSDDLPLYTILKQSGNLLLRYCIYKL